MVSLEIMGILIVAGMALTLLVPIIISKRIKHGEARFDSKTGKRIDDE